MKFSLKKKSTTNAPTENDEAELGGFAIGVGWFILIIGFLLSVMWIASLVKLARTWHQLGDSALPWLFMILFFGPLASMIFLFVHKAPSTPSAKPKKMKK